MGPGRWVARGLVALVVIALGLTAAGWWAVNHYDSRIERVDAFSGVDAQGRPEAPPTSTKVVQVAQNILLVGSDTREGEGNNRYGPAGEGARADTTILVHIPAGGGHATLVSIPRDSYVTIPACTGSTGKEYREKKGKFNTAFAQGGPACTIATVERLSGIRIDHYVEIDFAGLIQVVDAVGGVDVYLPEAVNDKDSELNLPAGVSHVDGEGALAFVRARKFDPRGDIGRIERQQQLLATLLQKVKSSEVLLNPSRLKGFLDTVTDAVRTDPGFGVPQMVELAEGTNGLDLSKVQFATPPLADPDYRLNGVSYVLLDEEGTAALFEAVRNDAPLPEGTQVIPGDAPTVPAAPSVPTPSPGPGS